MQHLSEYGKVAEEQMHNIEARYPAVKIHSFVIMPNHVHAVIELTPESAEAQITIHSIIGSYKSMVTRICKKYGAADSIRQRGYYEHIIRNDEDCQTRLNYIEQNPARWVYDDYYRV